MLQMANVVKHKTPRAVTLRGGCACKVAFSRKALDLNCYGVRKFQSKTSCRDGRIVVRAESTAKDDRDQNAGNKLNRYKVTLSKPLGVVLEEDRSGSIYVAELIPDGNAIKSGLIREGDRLISTSGYVYTTEAEYQGNQVRGGERLVTLNVKGESFNTVMAAIGSHPGHVKVQLELERGLE
uniref:PDZ domain-containing protein n=1 Tax=Tetraselmis sp. GSL018 TaxID=582737 RepID=A0A061R660_9CHLO|mmetsp:Transcript_18221/g.43613  ORF Transcript_18221/g.43613 Transcript_18221/m.43613 type:complete len:181 (+) Transcript_18221:93-635(+)